MTAAGLLATFLLVIPITWSTYIESVAANVDTSIDKKHEKFVPLVAFQCGYRNKFMSEDGSWVTDVNRYATCQNGKLDILKYCRKAYPKLDITNIVEYSHETKITEWCREEGSPCKWNYVVRPYQCIVGEFHSEALQVPHGCRFGHINDRLSCSDYTNWKRMARKQCQSKLVDGKRMSMRSLAVLEPCGLDLFRGIEFVCCSEDGKPEEVTDRVVDLDKNKEDEADDEDDDYDENYNEDDDEKANSKSGSQDPYFRQSDPANEHERFKEASERLDRRHRARLDKVTREWKELLARYRKMKESDAKGAEAFKSDMATRFQKTVASLEEENKEQKKQIEDVHEERVQANLNEKKRQATHDYRAALAIQMESANKHNVLKTLKTYIRAEEKDRTHMLNRYRHLLRTDQAEAEAFKPVLLHRLRYIDLRINGTLAMLRDFPELERQIRPIALEFWSDYRKENTPEAVDDEYTVIGDDEHNAKLIQMYKDSYDRIHNPTDHKTSAITESTTTSAVTTTKKSAPSTEPLPLSKSNSNEGSDDDDDDDEEEEEDDDGDGDDDDDDDIDEDVEFLHGSKKAEKIAVEKIVKRPTVLSNSKTIKKDLKKLEDKEDDDDGDDANDAKSVERELHVEIEPIINEIVRVHDLPPRPAYAKHEPLLQDKIEAEHNPTTLQLRAYSTHMLIMLAASATVLITLFIVVLTRRRSRHAGFIEVDVCTPEERHVNGMQVNGYENPTYSFFDSKP